MTGWKDAPLVPLIMLHSSDDHQVRFLCTHTHTMQMFSTVSLKPSVILTKNRDRSSILSDEDERRSEAVPRWNQQPLIQSDESDTDLEPFHVSTLAKSREFSLPVKKTYSPSLEALFCEKKTKVSWRCFDCYCSNQYYFSCLDLVEEPKHVVKVVIQGLQGFEQGVLVAPQQLAHAAGVKQALFAAPHDGGDHTSKKALILKLIHHRLQERRMAGVNREGWSWVEEGKWLQSLTIAGMLTVLMRSLSGPRDMSRWKM